MIALLTQKQIIP